MEEIIKVYHARLGDVIIERYEEEGTEKFHVIHTHQGISNSWHDYKRDAIVRAQFLAGKY